ncbi:hypothetical protein MVEN_01817500 [Mycena venus]|uniref:DUF6534 domain-containing protein n=1 Tax=Mycena venus TaxID=2733690 RepID=A0A8H6XJD7_9AGAR|nr:hypothetical protein MVEN_01817500 [Mycena venus]
MPSISLRQPPPEITLFGVLDLASGTDLFLQGVLCGQFAHYTNVNEQDSWLMKLFVAGLALLTTLKTVQILAIRWTQNVALFQNLEAVVNLWHTEWISRPTLILGAVIVFYVQMFFCHRLWILSHNRYIVVAAVTTFIFAIAAAGVATYLFTNITLSAIWIATHLGVAMGGDLLQTGSIVFYLLRHSKTVIRPGPTASMINSLLRVTIQSAAPGAFCALVNFITTIATVKMHVLDVAGLSAPLVASGVANTVLPKVYAIAAMWTLNSREDIRSAAANIHPTHLDLDTAALGGTSGPESHNYFSPGEVDRNGRERIEVKNIERHSPPV